jgi:N-acetyl sugar amidotransferase
MKTCSKCLLPETHETISFNSEGVCSVCIGRDFRDTQVDWNKRLIDLKYLADKVRFKNDYDCIIPFSGGKDSTFTLYYVVNTLKLKPLVVSFDHGFYRPNMVENRNRVIESLGVDFLSFKPNWRLVKRLMLQSLLEKGDFCWHCHTGIFSYPMWIAIEKNIPLVIWGEPSSEYTSYYSYEEIELVDEDRFNQIVNLGISAEDMHLRVKEEDFSFRDFKPFTYPSRSLLREKNIYSIPLGSYIPWNTKEQSKIIMEELGWKGDEVEGVPPEFTYEKIECYMQGVRDYIKFRKRGYSRVTHLMGIDIRSGRRDRNNALEMVNKFEGQRPASLDIFLEFIGISENEFNKIVDKHKIDPWDDKVSIKIGKKPHDYELWQSKPGLNPEEASKIISDFNK